MSTGAPDQMGSWHAVHTVFHDAYLAPFRPFFTRVDRLAPLARDLAFEHAALRNTGLHPLNYAANLLANVSRMLFAAPLGVDLSAPIVIVFELSMAALLAGTATGAARLRRLGRPLPRETVPFAMLLVLGFGIHIFPTADPRMLMPLIPLLVWTAAQGWGRRPAAVAVGAPPLMRSARASPSAVTRHPGAKDRVVSAHRPVGHGRVGGAH